MGRSGEHSPTDDREAAAPVAIVGIGASAGGLAALKTFFANVSEDSGMAYIVVTDLAPSQQSGVVERVQSHARIRVVEVTTTTRIEPNTAYILSPDIDLEAVDTHLRLSSLDGRWCVRAPVDHLLRTLAEGRDGDVVAVILSGTGSDGAVGTREIKEHGGLTVVQDPLEAEFDGMPQGAIATGQVDMILPLASIPEVIEAFVSARPELSIPAEGEEPEERTRELLEEVLTRVRARTSRDFSHYKTSTIVRRIIRRMQFRRIEDPGVYVEVLRSDPDEVLALADDLLITVSSFFRDREVFQKLEEEIIPRLFDLKTAKGEIRAWSVGCATGEEAYSLAMLLLEEATRRESVISLQVFASDLHPHALAKAREGFYSGDIGAEMGEQRLRRFFDEEPGGYRVRPELREIIVFSPHNLLGDPPFSRMDLITCRNLLIYLKRELQRQVIELFHYALQPDGYLVLGASEGVEAGDIFGDVDKTLRIYQKRNVPPAEPRLPVFPLTRSHLPGGPSLRETTRRGGLGVAYDRIHDRILEEVVPPSVLVSADDNVVHFAAHRPRCFVHPRGVPTTKIFELVREELRIELRAALLTARQQARCRSEPVRLQIDSKTVEVVIDVVHSPLPEHEGFLLVVFEERELPDESPTAEPASADTDERDSWRARDRLAEQEQTRRRLQAVIDEYETTQEELEASNEELQSTNEELRSALEELEMNKEELQSTNEELRIVNHENRVKVEEFAQLSSDLYNLFASTDIATLFLDRQLRILRFTPPAAKLFNVRLIDRGRPIGDITHRLNYDELRADAERVLERLVPVEREVRDDQGRTYLARVLPYRGTDDRVEGVVVTFFDITIRVQTQEALRRYREQYQRLFQTMHEGFCILAQTNRSGEPADLRVAAANPAFAEQTEVGQVVGKTIRELFPRDINTWMAVYEEVLRSGEPQRFECTWHESGRTLEFNAFRTDDADGHRLAVLCQDISARKQWERALRSKERELANELDVMTRLHRLVVRLVAAPTVLAALEEVLAATMEITRADMGNVRLADPQTGALELVVQRGFAPEVLPALAAAAVEGGSASAEAIRTKERVVVRDVEDPSYAGFRELAMAAGYRGLQSTPLVSRDGELLGVLSTHYRGPFEPSEADLRLLDLYTRPAIHHIERSRSELAIRQSEARFRAMFEGVGVAAWETDCDGSRILEVNESFAQMLGSSRDALVGRTTVEVIHPDDRARMARGLERLRAGEIETFHTEMRFLRVDSSSFWGFVAITVVPGGTSCVALMFDVSRRREVERSLEEQSQRKDEFLAMLGHELRNPLAAIQSATELVGLSMKGETHLQHAHDVLRRQTEHMVRLVDGLVDISRIERNKVELELQVLDLRRVLAELVEDRAEAIEARGLTLSAVLPSEPIWVSADATRLTQIFDNLLGNASKFTSPPGVITLRLFEEAGTATVRIKDTGIGIREEMLTSIFEPFRQDTGRARSGGGLGLGLALAKGLVELHRGTIEARSAGPGQGAEFVVQLPTVVPPGGESVAGEPKADAGTPPLDILLVEDNPDTARMLAEVLRLRGHEVTTTRDGRRALDLLREHGADVVLCDIGLPGMSGYDFARAVRADSTLAHICLIAYTGYGQAEDRQKTIEAGFDAHLTKPVDLTRLEETLAGLSARSSSVPSED